MFSNEELQALVTLVKAAKLNAEAMGATNVKSLTDLLTKLENLKVTTEAHNRKYI